MATKTQQREGWEHFLRTLTAHYIRGTETLCGKYVSDSQDVWEPPLPGDKKCKRCSKALGPGVETP